MLKYILLIALFFLVTACSPDDQPGKKASSVATQTSDIISVSGPGPILPAADFKLIFFINPDGGPCIMQGNILKEMTDELSGKVGIQYVQTNIQADLNIFNQYGIRSLPTLVLADASGKEVKRLAPGVKNSDEIRLLLQAIPQP